VGIAAFIGGIEDAAVNRLQAIANIRQRAADDHAHRVVEIRLLEFGGDGNRGDIARTICPGRGRILRRVAQAENVQTEGGSEAGIQSSLLAHLCTATQTFAKVDPQPLGTDFGVISPGRVGPQQCGGP
jgi:hypothetical protein